VFPNLNGLPQTLEEFLNLEENLVNQLIIFYGIAIENEDQYQRLTSLEID